MRMIDADALTNTIAGKIAEFETIDDCTAETLRKCKAIIEKQPSIDAVPVVHAHITGTGYHLHCSNCKKSADIGSDYCPHCGAKMDAPDQAR